MPRVVFRLTRITNAGPQNSLQRPFFSQSPERVGSGPSRPPISGAGVASGTDCSVFPGVGVWVVSPIIPGSSNCCSLIPGPGLDKLPDKPTVSAHAPAKAMLALPADRKTGVLGKVVSVRIVHCGRRLIKNKNS